MEKNEQKKLKIKKMETNKTENIKKWKKSKKKMETNKTENIKKMEKK